MLWTQRGVRQVPGRGPRGELREALWWEELKDLDAVYDCVGEKDVYAHAQLVLKDTGKFVTIAAMGVEGFAWERGVTGAFHLTNSSSRDDLDTLKGL